MDMSQLDHIPAALQYNRGILPWGRRNHEHASWPE